MADLESFTCAAFLRTDAWCRLDVEVRGASCAEGVAGLSASPRLAKPAVSSPPRSLPLRLACRGWIVAGGVGASVWFAAIVG